MPNNSPEKGSRLYMIDSLRGLAILLMVAYHSFYNIRYIFGNPFQWIVRMYPLQQAACWLFILIAGFSASLSRSNLRRGLLVSACGVGLTAFTLLFMPSEKIIWGVLSFLGAAMLLTHFAQPLLKRVPGGLGLAGSAALFALTRDIQYGHLGFEGRWLAALPAGLYSTPYLFPLGFPDAGFWSADYFPVLPWIFLYLTGFYLYRLASASPEAMARLRVRVPVLAALGRHSLVIYLLHQPVIFGAMWLAFRL